MNALDRASATARAQAADAWRRPEEVVAGWPGAGDLDPRLLRSRVRGRWWELLDRLGITLLVTREYEHLVVAMSVDGGRPDASFLPLPHPSGLVVDRDRSLVHVASTRNPTQVLTLSPALDPEGRIEPAAAARSPLVPVRARWLPGRLYLHDLALVGGELLANAVGENTVIGLDAATGWQRRWWPASIDGPEGPLVDRNHLQLNSIAGGVDLASSYFSASAHRPIRSKPGRLDFPVDGRGVVFSGRTREPVIHGLTRPHSARIHEERVWVANSGYGEVVVGSGAAGGYDVVTRTGSWTRGLCIVGDIAFIGTSRVIERFSVYAPGLDPQRCVCGVTAVDIRSGSVLGTIEWPSGNQIFAIDWIDRSTSAGFVHRSRRAPAAERSVFSGFDLDRRPNSRPAATGDDSAARRTTTRSRA